MKTFCCHSCWTRLELIHNWRQLMQNLPQRTKLCHDHLFNCSWFTLRLRCVFSAKPNLSRSITPTATASTRVAPARCRWRPCRSTPRCWSTTCRRCRRRRAGRRATPRRCPGRESGNERGSGLRTARGRRATGGRGVRANWCSWRTETQTLFSHPSPFVDVRAPPGQCWSTDFISPPSVALWQTKRPPRWPVVPAGGQRGWRQLSSACLHCPLLPKPGRY